MTDHSFGRMHGQVKKYTKCDDLPSRALLYNKDLTPIVNQQIREKSTFLFLPNDVRDHYEYQGGYNNSVQVYNFIMYGILENGEKVAVIVENSDVFFDILVPKGVKYTDHQNAIQAEIDQCNFIQQGELAKKNKKFFPVKVKHFSMEVAKPIKYYRKKDREFVRVHLYSNWDRKKLITYFSEIAQDKRELFQTYSNDGTNYYRIMSRLHNLQFGAWMNISQYRPASETVCTSFRVNIDNITMCETELIDKTAHLQKPYLIHQTWDIETRMSNGIQIECAADHVKVINSTFQLINSVEPALTVSLCIGEPMADPTTLIISCADERQLISAFGQLIGRMRPDIISGFNDGYFDWPFLSWRICRFGMVRDFYESCTMMMPSKYAASDTKILY